MSYSKSYSGSVPYSGTVHYSASYGPSEHGGTVSGSVGYSGFVPVTVNLYVDTNPFDNSVNNCSKSVRNLNGAVIAMNSAQVASITRSANDVSGHIITGFFNMIGSELSQNMAALFAKFKSVFELLVTKSSTLEKQQLIMQDDYLRVSERYNQIFRNLDEELEKRIVALDKNVFEISKKVQGEQLHSETSKKVAQFLIGVNEDEIVQQQLIIANAKDKVQQAMDGLAQNIIQGAAYSKKVDSIVSDVNCNSGQKTFIPVIYTESSNLNSDITDYNCFSNPNSAEASQRINESIKNYFVSNNANSNNELETKKIDEAFTLIAEREFENLKDEKSLRIYEVLKQLKEN